MSRRSPGGTKPTRPQRNPRDDGRGKTTPRRQPAAGGESVASSAINRRRHPGEQMHHHQGNNGSVVVNGVPRFQHPEPPEGDRQPSFSCLTFGEFMSASFAQEYLIEGVLAAGQPGLIAGSKKT